MSDAVLELSQPDKDLQKACSYLDVELAAKAIAAGANVNMADEGGTPIVFNKDLVLYNTDDGDDDGDILADLAEWSSATR